MRTGSEPKRHAIVSVPFVIWRTALTLIVLGSFPDVFLDASAQQTEPQRSSQNAADYYRRAADLIERLPAADNALIESTAELHVLALYGSSSPWSTQEPVRFSDSFPSGEDAAATEAKLEPALHLFRQGAESPNCDWEFDFHSGNLSAPIPHLPIVTGLVRSALFRARYNWTNRMREEAVKDLAALNKFATHVGAAGEGGLISLVVQFNIERVATYTISNWLVDAESAGFLSEVAEEPVRPPVNLAKKGLLLETETVLPLARSLIDSSGLSEEQRRDQYAKDLFTDVYTIGQLVRRYSEEGLLEQIEESRGHYHKVGRLLDLPVDKFQPKFDTYMRELARTGNFFSEVGLIQCPGIERVYYDVNEMHVRWRMIQAAIDIVQSGLGSLARHTDPFSSEPFAYRLLDDGFELSSKFVVNGAPVTMIFYAAAS